MPACILIADDEPDLKPLILQRFRRRITSGELDFVFAKDGEQALQILESNPAIELVITDINMPVMDGLTLLSKIASLPRLLKTVIVSAYDDMENIRTAMNRGAYDFLTKPIDFGDLEKTIDKTRVELAILRQGQEAQKKLSVLDHELEVATKIQFSILPEIISDRDEFEISATMLAARQVSGDFYDFFFIDQNRLGLAIGDVSGKGIPAALFMAVSRTLLRATALRGVSPAVCLEEISRVLLKQSKGEVFLTLFYGILDLTTGELEFSAGAQTPPYMFSPFHSGKFLREPGGIMLGLLEEAVYGTGTALLLPGEGIIFYTDGITEAEDGHGEFFLERRLQTSAEDAKLSGVQKIVSTLVDDIQTFTGGQPQSDDITLLAIRYRPNNEQIEEG